MPPGLTKKEKSTGDKLLTSSKAEDRFRKHFKKLEAPESSEPRLPKEITYINSDQLGELQNRYAAWREFTEDLMQEGLADFLRLQEEYDNLYDVTFISQTSGKVTDNKTLTRIDDDVRKKYLSLQEADLYHKMLGNKLAAYNNCLTIISREITRRQGNA